MMKQAAVARTVDLEPIDRLEEKIKLLVSMVTTLRADQARTIEENARLSREIEMLRARLVDAENVNAETAALREEREVIRSRVSEMLQQLEGLAV